jgi:hypothetical protein
MEARMGKLGKREFVQVLRLMEVFPLDEVAGAVRDAIARGAIGFDAVKHLILCRIERRPPRLAGRAESALASRGQDPRFRGRAQDCGLFANLIQQRDKAAQNSVVR